ncbi:MAG: DsbA family protein [Chitinophagaceae bacterium]
MQPIFIYCFDAYCGWCFGFSPVIKKIWLDYRQRFDFEVLSGGMILTEKPVHISVTAPYILQTYKNVEAATGITFGEDFLWHIKNPGDSDWYPNSKKPSIALCIFKEYFPEQQVAFATDLQYALHVEGRDLCDDEAYRHLVIQYNIPEKEFFEKLHSDIYKENAYYEFALVKQLKITGYPCLLLQLSELKLHLLTNGYTDYHNLAQKINSVLEENHLQKI